MDVDSGNRLVEQEFPDIGEIYNPACRRTGSRSRSRASRAGCSTCFLFDLGTKALTQLTNDPFADSDPEWFPTAVSSLGHRPVLRRTCRCCGSATTASV